MIIVIRCPHTYKLSHKKTKKQQSISTLHRPPVLFLAGAHWIIPDSRVAASSSLTVTSTHYVLLFPLYVSDTCPCPPLTLTVSSYKHPRDPHYLQQSLFGFCKMEEATLPPLPPSLSALYPDDGDFYTATATATTTSDDNDSSLYSLFPFSLSSSTNNYTSDFNNNNNIFFSPLLCSNNDNNNNNSLNIYTVKDESFYEPEKPFDFFAQNAPFSIPNNNIFNDYCCFFSTSSLTQQQETKTFDFFSAAAANHHHHHHLPELQSLESPPPPPPPPPSPKRHHLAITTTTGFKNGRNRETARPRRQTLGEKMSRLRKLMPLDQKMDMVTTLEEAYKYVKFLQAQVKVLQSMPPLDRYKTHTFTNDMRNMNNGMVMAEALGVLSRQQMLEVVLGSSAAQTWL